MSRTIKLRGSEAACGTNVGASSNYGLAHRVRLFNSAGSGTNYLITLVDESDNTLGTCTLHGGDVLILDKRPTDKIFAANAHVLAVAIAVKD